MKSGALQKRIVVLWVFGVCLTALTTALPGCGKPEDVQAKTARQETAEKITPEERSYYDAAKPFAEAIAARNYNKAYEFLSSHAKARMSPNQFVAPDDDATAARNEKAVAQNVTAEKFGQMLAPMEKAYGKPAGKILNLHVFSTDPKALSGKGQGLEKLDSMFAIGMMPTSIPTDIRKASVRSKLKVELSAEQLAEAAKAEQTTPEKLKADPEFQPYVTLKIVLVQEAGALKVGYFEFLPPGILD